MSTNWFKQSCAVEVKNICFTKRVKDFLEVAGRKATI